MAIPQTPKLGLKQFVAGQLNAFVRANETFNRLDAMVQLAVENSIAGALRPPSNPVEGQRWLVSDDPDAGTPFEGHAGEIACFYGGGWFFVVPKEGWTCFFKAEPLPATRFRDASGNWFQVVL